MAHFGIGIYQPKTHHNIGLLWRSAYILGASYIFTIEGKYKRQASDVLKSWSEIPLFQYDSFEEFYNNLPYSCRLIGIELAPTAQSLESFEHPSIACYLLGAEDNGLPNKILNQCHGLVQLKGNHSLNVSVSGSIVLHDRNIKLNEELPEIRKTRKLRS